MARTINPSDKERQERLKRNQELRDEIYRKEGQRSKFSEQEIEETAEPLEAVGPLIRRFQKERTEDNQDTKKLSTSRPAIIDLAKGEEAKASFRKSLGLEQEVSGTITKPVSNKSTRDVKATSSNNVPNLYDNDTSSLVSKSSLGSFSDSNINATGSSNVTTLYPEYIKTKNNSDLSITSKSISSDTSIPFVTSNSKQPSFDFGPGYESVPSSFPISDYHRVAILRNIFIIEKELSNVQKNFIVSLILEMNYTCERISINSIIRKYEMRKATVFSIIPQIVNMGILQIFSDHRPTGSEFNITGLFQRYNIQLRNDNDTSNELVTSPLLDKEININTNLINNDEAVSDFVTTIINNPILQIKLKSSILATFKTMMFIPMFRSLEVYNDNSMLLFARYLAENECTEQSRADLIGLALMCSERAKTTDRIIYYLQKTFQQGGIDSLQIAFKEKAKKLFDFTNVFFELDLEEPSLSELKTIARTLSTSDNRDRASLVIEIDNIRRTINKNCEYIEDVISRMPIFSKKNSR